MDDNLAAVDRHVRHCPMGIPVDLRRRSSAHGTQHGYSPSAGRDHHCAAALRHVLNDQRRQSGKYLPNKGVDIHHKIMITDGYSTSLPTTGQSRSSFDRPDPGSCLSTAPWVRRVPVMSEIVVPLVGFGNVRCGLQTGAGRVQKRARPSPLVSGMTGRNRVGRPSRRSGPAAAATAGAVSPNQVLNPLTA